MENNSFQIENNVLVKYIGNETIVTIPDEVTKIGTKAFFGNETITTVIISNNCELIEKLAFGFCSNLHSVRLGNMTRVIESNAFEYCDNLVSVTNAIALEEIKSNAFSNNKNLVDFSLFKIKTCSEYAFVGCNKDFVFEIEQHLEQVEKIPYEKVKKCPNCGKPMYSQNRIRTDRKYYICNECAFEDYSNFVQLKQNKFKFDSKMQKKKSNEIKGVAILMLLAIAVFEGISLTIIKLFFSLGGLPVAIFTVILFSIGFKIFEKVKDKKTYLPTTINEYLEKNNIKIEISNELDKIKNEESNKDNSNNTTKENTQTNYIKL